MSLQAFLPATVEAATQITNRNLTLQAGTTDGGSLFDGEVTHNFNFMLHNTASSLGSIKFQYCTTAAPVPNGVDCDAPVGIDTTNANLSGQTGAIGFTGITKSSEDDAGDGIQNVMVISRGVAATLPDGGADTGDGDAEATVSYTITKDKNPTAVNETFFVRISTYSSLDGTGTPIESGTVAASTAYPINIDGTMPESLVFCTGATIGLTAGVVDCATATPGDISFDRLFSPTDTAIATSQMAASTNAGQGYSISVHGSTMTSGSNTISAMNAADVSKLGVSQFGMNVVNNAGDTNGDGVIERSGDTDSDGDFDDPTDPIVGADISPVSNGTNFNAEATAGYDTDSQYKYTDGDVVADSAGLGTDSQLYTASYIVNVPGSQPAGGYSTTLTYICTATF
ncbi:MAG TPA: hypothetical protein VFK03_01395 [Candidatus Saccharimonadales bacterium]|nr:hypothetical protein [Candidatus Saccharimonadales bacterium]